MIARMLILALALIAIMPAANAENDREVDYGRACEAYNQGAYFTAFHDLMPFAVRGDAQAQFAVGEMLRTGSGTRRNREEALIWTRRAAEQGHRQTAGCPGRHRLVAAGRGQQERACDVQSRLRPRAGTLRKAGPGPRLLVDDRSVLARICRCRGRADHIPKNHDNRADRERAKTDAGRRDSV